MIDYQAWRGDTIAARAIAAWQRIQDRPTTLIVRRTGAALAAQTVRVDYTVGGREDEDVELNPHSLPGIARVLIYGVRGHATQPDTDLRRGDRAVIMGGEVEIVAVAFPPGELIATAELRF